MPATLAELSFSNGVPSLHCPATGRLVHDAEVGIELASPQTPHLRFVIDWIGDSYVAPLESVPEDQKAYHLQVIRLLQSDKFENQNALVAACVKVMPSSAIVFELLDAPRGSSDGEIAYFGFDLATVSEDGGRTDRTLVAVDELALDQRAMNEEMQDPRSAPFGYFSTDMFGVGVFSWHSDSTAALDVYVNTELDPHLLDGDEEAIAAVKQIFREAIQKSQGLNDVAEQLNEVTDEMAALQWWGTFTELCEGSGDFPRQIRESSREDADLDEGVETDAPILESGIEEFVSFLSEYGH